MTQPAIPPLSLVIDQAGIRRYAELTGDANPLHLDAAFAATTRLGGIVAHGTLGSNLVWQMFDAAGVDVAEVALRFLAPVRPGDTVTAMAEARPEGGYRVAIRNQQGQEVVAGTALARPAFDWAPVSLGDAPALADLRVRAMRPSLEAVGRFDPQRARARLLEGFDPACTRAVQVDGRCVGVVVLRVLPDHWRLDHLYIEPDVQGQGIGSAVLQAVMAEARDAGQPMALSALRDSPSNAFYRRHGWRLVDESEWDLHYAWP